jgi:hypothetical protein
MRVHSWLGLTLCLACSGQVGADLPAGNVQPHSHWVRNGARTCPPVGACPNDYVRKPFPSILPIPRCGTTDDYCRKPLPSVPAVPRCGGPNDYCRKPLPNLLCPPLSPYLQCGPTDGSCFGCGKGR